MHRIQVPQDKCDEVIVNNLIPHSLVPGLTTHKTAGEITTVDNVVRQFTTVHKQPRSGKKQVLRSDSISKLPETESPSVNTGGYGRIFADFTHLNNL